MQNGANSHDDFVWCFLPFRSRIIELLEHMLECEQKMLRKMETTCDDSNGTGTITPISKTESNVTNGTSTLTVPTGTILPTPLNATDAVPKVQKNATDIKPTQP